MKKLLLLPVALLLFNCTADSLNGCPTIKTYRTYTNGNGTYAELHLSDGSTVHKPLVVVEKQVGGTSLIGKEFCN